MKSNRQSNIFEKLVTWSLAEDALRINEFCTKEGITFADLRSMAGNNPQHFKCVGKVQVCLFENANKAFKVGKITREEYAKLLREEHGFEDPELIISDAEDSEDLDLMNELESEDIHKQLNAAMRAFDKYGHSRYS